MKYAFFIGCATPVLTANYELATRKVAETLGIELVDIEDFACCGFPLKSVNQEAAMLMAVRTLSIAEKHGLNICTICPGCTSMLTEASKKLEEDQEQRREINNKLKQIGRTYSGNIKVKHFIRVLYEDVGIDKLSKKVKKSLEGLKIAPHYGCHYTKPSEIYDSFEDPELPKTLDELISFTGAESANYENKIQCCGGYVLGVDENISFTLASKKLDHVRASEVDAISLLCPLCSVMYDRNQRVIERRFNKSYDLPVLFYPQILGLALGIDPTSLGLDMNRVKPNALLEKLQAKTEFD